MQGPWKYSLPISMSWLLCLAGHRYVLASCPDVTVTREVLRDGFHRDLLTKVELGTVDEDIGHCSVAIKEQLPAGLYVDPNELASLQQHNRTEALIVPDAVDVEAPEYLATDLVVLIYMKSDPRCTHCFQATLPVHCRYHRPTENDGRVPAALKNPEILIRCPESFPPMKCWRHSEVEAPCSVRTESTCHWNNVKYKPVNKELILQVPVGLKQHSSLVCAVTLLTTVLCSSLVLAAVCKHGHFFLVNCS